MQRYFIQLSFHGKNYHGWQVQANAHSVQAELNKALYMLTKEKTETIGCGRTDTGVHAKIFFAHFDADSRELGAGSRKKSSAPHSLLPTPYSNFIHQLNCVLPNDIAVQGLFHVADDAHARFDAVSRTYQCFHLYSYKDPFLANRACFIPYEVDVEKMNDLCEILTESSADAVDYSCFSKNRTQTKTKQLQDNRGNMEGENGVITFQITADRFLRNMVRAIVGTMLQAGKGKLNKQGCKIIEAKKRSEAGHSVPAQRIISQRCEVSI